MGVSSRRRTAALTAVIAAAILAGDVPAGEEHTGTRPFRERKGRLVAAGEPVVLARHIQGRFYTPRLCPHDEFIYSVESVTATGNHAWLVFEREGEVREVTTAGTGESPELNELLGGSSRAHYSGQVAWCPRKVSRDRHWFLFASTGQAGNTDLYLGNTRDPSATRITEALGADGQPCWTPDGDRAVYVAAGSGRGDLMVQTGLRKFIDGGGKGELPPPRVLTSGPAIDAFPEVSPDGKWVVFSRRLDIGPETTRDLYVVSLDEAAAAPVPRLLTALQGEESRPAWSPDGRWIAFFYSATAAEERVDLFVGRVEGPPTEPRLTGLRFLEADVEPDIFEGPAWSPFWPGAGNVRSLMYLARSEYGATLEFVDLKETFAGEAIVGGSLPIDLDLLSGFDFSGWTRGVICGQQGTDYRAQRVVLRGESFLTRPFD